MTLEVINLIYLIHKAPFKQEGWNKIAFTTVYCTWFRYVDNCLKIPIIAVFRSKDTQVICFCFVFIVRGYFLCNTYLSFNFLLNLLVNNLILCFIEVLEDPNISMHILHTVLNKFPDVLVRRILFNNQEVLQLIIISFILVTLMLNLGMILKGEIRCWSLSGMKVLIPVHMLYALCI